MRGQTRWARLGGWLVSGIGAVAMAWGGCGGKAVIDAGGGGGASSSGTGTSTSTSGSSTSTSTSTSTSGVGGGPGSLCAEACAQIQPCAVNGDGCTSFCESAQDQCVGQQDSYLGCVVGGGGSGQCGGMPGCGGELNAFLACKGLASMGGTCAGGPGGQCSCSVTDSWGLSYQSDCFGDGSKQSCSCLFEGMPVGKCTFPSAPVCDPWHDCCATVYFVPFLPGMVNG